MAHERAKEQIKFNIEAFKLMIGTLVGIIAGIIALIISERVDGPKLVFITLGLLMAVAITILSFRIRRTIQDLINAIPN